MITEDTKVYYCEHYQKEKPEVVVHESLGWRNCAVLLFADYAQLFFLVRLSEATIADTLMKGYE